MKKKTKCRKCGQVFTTFHGAKVCYDCFLDCAYGLIGKKENTNKTEEDKYSVYDFIYWLEKNCDVDEKKYTHSQITQIIAKGMIDFFDESETGY